MRFSNLFEGRGNIPVPAGAAGKPCGLHLTARDMTRIRSRLESLRRIVDALGLPTDEADELRALFVDRIWRVLEDRIIDLVAEMLNEFKAATPRGRRTVKG